MAETASPDRPAVFAGLVPLTARPTLFYDLRSAPFNGVFLGVMSLLPWVLKDTFKGTDWEVAVLTAAPPLAHLFDMYWAHLCSERRKMAFVLWPGLVARFLIVLAGLALNSEMLLVLGCLSYLVGSIATPAVISIWRTNYPGTHRYQVVGTVMGLMTLSMAVTAFVAGLVLQTFEKQDYLFRVIFAVGGTVGMLGTYVFSRIKVRGESLPSQHARLDRAPRTRFDFFRDVSLLWRNRKFGKYMLLQFTSGFSNIMTLPALVAMLKYQEAGWLAAAVVLGFAPNILKALAMPWWGRLLQRFNPMQARGYFNLLWASTFLLIGLSGRQVGWVIVARLLVGVAMGATMLLWSLQQMYFARKEDVPKYMGLHCTLTGIRGLIAPFVGVLLMKYVFGGRPHGVFLVSAGLTTLAGLLSLRMARAERRTTNHTGHVDGGGVTD